MLNMSCYILTCIFQIPPLEEDGKKPKYEEIAYLGKYFNGTLDRNSGKLGKLTDRAAMQALHNADPDKYDEGFLNDHPHAGSLKHREWLCHLVSKETGLPLDYTISQQMRAQPAAMYKVFKYLFWDKVSTAAIYHIII